MPAPPRVGKGQALLLVNRGFIFLTLKNASARSLTSTHAPKKARVR